MGLKLSKINFSSWGVLIGLVVGATVGFILNYFFKEDTLTQWVIENVFQPIGTIFLRSLFMVAVPLVFSSLTLGVAGLGDTKTLKRLGFKVMGFYIVTTFIAIMIGQFLINSFEPGNNLSQPMMDQVMESQKSQVSALQEKSSWVGKSLWPGLVSTTIPKNILKEFANSNMLAVIFVSFMFGFGLIYIREEKHKQALKNILGSICDITIMIVNWIMKLAPIAVAALIAVAVFNFGLDTMVAVSKYLGCVLLAYLIHFVLVYGAILKYIIKIPLKEFYKRASRIFITAFSTSSSSATMPVTMETLESRFGIPSKIVSFTIPVGVTFNMDGTALFEMMAAIFIAQAFGIELSLVNHVTLIILVLVTSIGVAGVPGVSIPILMAAMATVGIPAEGIALILGVDRLLDMGRTVVNVTGDTVATLFVAKQSGVDVQGNLKKITG